MSKENDERQSVSLQRVGREKIIEDLVWSLFKEVRPPLFNNEKVHRELIDKFVRDKEVLRSADDFVQSLINLWRARFPGKQRLSINKRPSTEIMAKSVQFPILPTPTDTRAVLDKASSISSASLVAPALQHIQPSATGGVMTPKSPAQESANTDQTVTARAAIGDAAASAAPTPPPTPATHSPAAARSDQAVTSSLKPGQVPATAGKPNPTPEPKPEFRLPNCKVGIAYSARIESADQSGRNLHVVDLKLPDALGLKFEPATQMVTGLPRIDGEFNIDLQYRLQDAHNEGRSSGFCKLTSTPDPKSLWKVVEPAPELPYRKAHLDQKCIQGKDFKIVAASRRGRSHEHGGSFRDDDFFIHDDPASGWSVLIVADGAGSAKSSREGSRIAVTMAGKYLVDDLAGEFGTKMSGYLSDWDANPSAQTAIGSDFHYFFHKMANTAVQAIEQEAQAKNVPVKEFSTTLLVAVVRKEGSSTFLATFWMGDGAIAAYGPCGTVKLMGTPDGGEFAGQTRFLDRNALVDQGFGKRVRVGRLQNLSSVILLTDGVSDPYFETDNGLADPAKWDGLWNEIQPLLCDVAPEQRLVGWLHFFKQGHHDDRTIALLW